MFVFYNTVVCKQSSQKMFSSDSSFSWLLLYQHLALSSCSAQRILESFSGKKNPPQHLDFWEQRFFLYFSSESSTFTFFCMNRNVLRRNLGHHGEWNALVMRGFSCQYFLSGLWVWACVSRAVLGTVFSFGCVCTMLQNYYYGSFRQTQGSLKQINLDSSSRAAAGLRFHWLIFSQSWCFCVFHVDVFMTMAYLQQLLWRQVRQVLACCNHTWLVAVDCVPSLLHFELLNFNKIAGDKS